MRSYMISTINNNVMRNISYKDFIRDTDGNLKIKSSHMLMNRPVKNWTLDSFDSKGVR